jgi:hypothetical protein
MQSAKLTVLLSALALGVTASAGAQTVAVEIIEAPAVSGGQVVIIAPAPQPMPDPAAAQKCQSVSSASYWDCVNSHKAGQ